MYYNYSDLNYINQELAGVWPGWTAVKLLGRGSFGAVYEINRNIRGTLEKSAMKVLFVGNSHTYFNDMPQTFADMCLKGAGEKTDV